MNRNGGLPVAGRPECNEVATLFALTQNPCQKWEDLEYGKAALLYQRTQHVLQAARLLPAHRRLLQPFSVVFGGSFFRYSHCDFLPTCQCLGVCGRLNKQIPPILQ